ncbi:SsgA family sporulation/cell division regulator [Streptomyces sp900105245]|uniref:SsgA family sporulation/cell division regulator n=1 Tax=Streptomyces sp. 900105245 TaxID=3154379 RepID=A0ABV1UK37_9ACTN
MRIQSSFRSLRSSLDGGRENWGLSHQFSQKAGYGRREYIADMFVHMHSAEHSGYFAIVPARFIYRTSDPYAVEVRFNVGATCEQVWTFVRDLIRDGLSRAAGFGDVVVWPGASIGGERQLFIQLASPDGTAVLAAPEGEMRAFVQLAGRLVGYGKEYIHAKSEIDDLVANIREG